jgi:WD40 repeat protein/tRNA A-37 threonylcarbamoyl transferase component Bud32
MFSDDDLIDFLTQAEEWNEQGRAFTVADLCPDHSEYWPRLEELWQGMRQLNQQLHVAEASHHGSEPSVPPPSTPLPIEAFAGKGYEILDEIGRGGMGVVYRARQVGLKRLVAIKMVLAGRYASPKQLARFQRETEILARLNHPNVVQIYEVGELDGMPFFCMEYMDGGSLAVKVKGQPQQPEAVAELVEILARAVHVAHEQGIVHRDLKPANILINGAGVPKITDFGLAKHLQEEAGQTGGDILGTPSYLAPEQVRREGVAIGPATDVYALGVILYELLTGRLPHKGDSSMDTVLLVLHEEPVPPSRLRPRLPADLETITLKCLNKEPQKRYGTAAALADDLRRFLANEPILARPVSRWEQTIKWGRRRPALAATIAALLLVAVAGFVGILWQMLRAEAARAVAVLERETADNERSKAVRLAEDLRVQRDAAKWYTYRANLAATANALQLGNISSARRYLEAAPEQFRNWEWRHFISQLDRPQSILRGHEASVVAVAFSPDGKRLASGSQDGTMRLWDVVSGSTVAVLRGHAGSVWQVSYSQNGKYLASYSEDGTTRLWDMTTNQAGAILRGRFTPSCCLAFSPDSQHIAARATDGKVTLWDTTTGAQRRLLRQQTSMIGPVAFSPDGQRLVGGAKNGKLYLWEPATGDVRAIWEGHGAGVEAVAFSPDGTRIVSSGDYPDNTVRLWEVATRRSIVMKGHKNRVKYVAFSPDGTRILSASLDQTARLWHAANGQVLGTLQGHRGQVLAAAFDPTGKHVVTASRDQTLDLWDAQTGELITVLGGHQGAVWSVAFSPDGSRLASGSSDHTVRFWDVRLAEQNGVLRGHTSYVYGVAFSPDGNQVASAAWDGTVRFWEATTGQQTGRLDQEQQIVTSVAFAPDGRQLVTGLRGNIICLWDLATRKRRYTRQVSVAPLTDTRAVFDPRGRFVASAAGADSAHLWDVASGQAIAVLGAHGGGSCDVAFSPDGGQLASAERDGTVRLWEVPTGQPKGVLPGHMDMVLAVCYSPDRSLLASAGEDSTVRLWDPKTQTPLAVLRHPGPVYSVAFTPDGTRLAAACRDSTIRLWDVAMPEEVAELRGHSDYVHGLAFSPHGSRLVSGSGDYTVRIWDTLPPHVRAKMTRGKRNNVGNLFSFQDSVPNHDRFGKKRS